MKYLLLALSLIILVSGCTTDPGPEENPDCDSFSAENCPAHCVVCPPCEVCSSVSCQSEQFCLGMGFNRSWYPATVTDPFDDQTHETTDIQEKEMPYIGLWPQSPDCQDIDVTFSYSPVPLERITNIGPVGAITPQVSGHVIPNDHNAIGYSGGETDVIMPADGYLVMVERHQYTPPPGMPQVNHYHLYFEHSCSLYTGILHTTILDPALLEASEELRELDSKELTRGNENIWPRIPLKAGQRIGTSTQWGFVGTLAVDTMVDKHHSNPESYAGAPWRLHATSILDYFGEPLKSQLHEKNPRTAEPRSGKANYDIDGRLVGGWFEEGTNGMAGPDPGTEPEKCGNIPCSYWAGHLSFIYHYMEPEKIRIQFGYDLAPGVLGPYGVKGNAPDPADISVESGPVKYELVELLDVTEDTPGSYVTTGTPFFTVDKDEVVATLLVEMVDDMTIRVEPFVGKTAAQVSGFTGNARIYER